VTPTWRRLARHGGARFGAVVVLAFAVVAVLAPWVAPYDPEAIALGTNLLGPSWSHPFGTDSLGRDVLSRTIWGARISLTIGLVSVGLARVGGVPLGALAAWTAQVPLYARLTRAAVLRVRVQNFVEAARASGAGEWRIVRRHVLPNCLPPLLVQSTLLFATAILSAAYLGFLGLGAQPPTPEWGTMLAKARDFLRTAPHVSIFPGLTILMTVLGLNLLGDGLRDVLDPQTAG
jgi:peptide/nickel transport system permease protein